jgi:hypothetical protein
VVRAILAPDLATLKATGETQDNPRRKTKVPVDSRAFNPDTGLAVL